tara:strand:- start:1053 stop:1223 length:171 start_codon:yes stop_codon:yes gene_type:complete
MPKSRIYVAFLFASNVERITFSRSTRSLRYNTRPQEAEEQVMPYGKGKKKGKKRGK